MNLEQRIERLEQRIHDLRVDFERFFNGDLPAPPDTLRARIQSELRALRGVQLQTPVDTFRIAQLEARFNSYSELFNRRVREREEGSHRQRAHAEPPAPLDPAKGVVVGPQVTEAAAAALYRGLATDAGYARFDLDTFRSYLDRQLESIRSRTGCAEVQFRLISEDGRTKLKAKPLGAPPAAGRTS